mmetsp:Transcript_22673/g.52933  ORF Transcript_22673/g.52933 Transcript_22673/m.52933 type:complete len:215 (+) Transcript_22673:262-906(+)
MRRKPPSADSAPCKSQTNSLKLDHQAAKWKKAWGTSKNSSVPVQTNFWTSCAGYGINSTMSPGIQTEHEVLSMTSQIIGMHTWTPGLASCAKLCPFAVSMCLLNSCAYIAASLASLRSASAIFWLLPPGDVATCKTYVRIRVRPASSSNETRARQNSFSTVQRGMFGQAVLGSIPPLLLLCCSCLNPMVEKLGSGVSSRIVSRSPTFISLNHAP